MSFTKDARAAANAIVSCHETGKPIGNYSAVAVLPDGAGISYGTHQATHRAGSLYKIVKMFCDLSNSPVATKLRAYLPDLSVTGPSTVAKSAADSKLKDLLRAAGEEQLMRFAQNRVFERNYLDPAIAACDGSSFTKALSLAVIYDSMIQGGYATVRDKVKATGGEQKWIAAYVAARRKWLANHPKPIVRKTVYRMETFEKLMSSGNWDLKPDFIAHGAKVTKDVLAFWASAEKPDATPLAADAGDAHDAEIGVLHSLNTEGIAEPETPVPPPSPAPPAPEEGGASNV